MITAEMREIVEVCRKFAGRYIGPYALEADLNRDRDWLLSVWKKSAEIGIIGLGVPEELGGVGQTDTCCALVLDALASECPGVASLYLHQYVAIKAILAAGEPQKTSLISSLLNAGGHAHPIIALIFPSDVDEKRLSLRQEGERLFLSGASSLTGNVLLASHFLVFLREEGDSTAMTSIWIEKDSPGVTLGEDAGLPGLAVNPFASVLCADVEITSEDIIGERRQAKTLYDTSMKAWYGFIAACAMGAARSAFNKSVIYAKDRYQFGDKIIHHQEIQRMLGNMLTKLSVGTSSYLSALEGESNGILQEPLQPVFSKVFCTDAALEIAVDAVQIHGGYGYVREYEVERMYRDQRLCAIG
ncbi:MAG: acyl-CoA dehydrogenase family protein, partial [Desulfomonilia bacterium]|nr:acyl-CoA dehydrogenase family protein [Desulfomonilia bacterium]